VQKDNGEIKTKIADMATEICDNLDETISRKIQEQLTEFTTLSELINNKFFQIKSTLDEIKAT
jgi:short-subunit dehydrogenase involved in D-alanine esterification of teichoic acids